MERMASKSFAGRLWSQAGEQRCGVNPETIAKDFEALNHGVGSTERSLLVSPHLPLFTLIVCER